MEIIIAIEGATIVFLAVELYRQKRDVRTLAFTFGMLLKVIENIMEDEEP